MILCLFQIQPIHNPTPPVQQKSRFLAFQIISDFSLVVVHQKAKSKTKWKLVGFDTVYTPCFFQNLIAVIKATYTSTAFEFKQSWVISLVQTGFLASGILLENHLNLKGFQIVFLCLALHMSIKTTLNLNFLNRRYIVCRILPKIFLLYHSFLCHETVETECIPNL